MACAQRKKKTCFHPQTQQDLSIPDHFLKQQCFCSVARAHSWQSAALVLLGKERETKELTAITKQAEAEQVKRKNGNVSVGFSCSELCAYGVRSKGWMQTNEQLKSTKREREQKTTKQHCSIERGRGRMYNKTKALAACTSLSHGITKQKIKTQIKATTIFCLFAQAHK